MGTSCKVLAPLSRVGITNCAFRDRISFMMRTTKRADASEPKVQDALVYPMYNAKLGTPSSMHPRHKNLSLGSIAAPLILNSAPPKHLDLQAGGRDNNIRRELLVRHKLDPVLYDCLNMSGNHSCLFATERLEKVPRPGVTHSRCSHGP